jgi:signal transduction histidine kinase
MPNNFDIYIRVIIVMLSFTVIAIGFVLAFIKYQKKIVAKQKELYQLDSQYKQDLLTNTIHSAETERVRIAKELHDEVGSILSTLSLSVGQIKNETDQTTMHITNAKELVQLSINSVRRISRGIAPYELELLGLASTLKNHFETIATVAEIKINLQIQCDLKRFNYQTGLAIYRISQELTSNCIKYAKATTIDFTISEDTEKQVLKINYKDNGLGLVMENQKFSKGIGLKNIESRAIAMNGTCRFNSAPNAGFSCEIEIPIQAYILYQL